MEILSDATFKGGVTLSNSSVAGQGLKFVSSNGTILQLSTPETLNDGSESNGCVLQLGFNGGGWGGAGIGFETDTIFVNYLKSVRDARISNLYVENANVSVNYKDIKFPSSSGTLALTSQIPSLSGYLTTSAASSTYLSKTDASSTYQKKFTTFSSPSIPANCTAFEFTGTAISDSNKTHLIQVQNTSTGKSVIAETWMTTNKKPAMSFAGCTSTVAAGTYTAIVL